MFLRLAYRISKGFKSGQTGGQFISRWSQSPIDIRHALVNSADCEGSLVCMKTSFSGTSSNQGRSKAFDNLQLLTEVIFTPSRTNYLVINDSCPNNNSAMALSGHISHGAQQPFSCCYRSFWKSCHAQSHTHTRQNSTIGSFHARKEIFQITSYGVNMVTLF